MRALQQYDEQESLDALVRFLGSADGQDLGARHETLPNDTPKHQGIEFHML